MTNDEHYDHLRTALSYAGGFHTALIEAYFKADGGNQRRLEEAFPHDCNTPIGKLPLTELEKAIAMLDKRCMDYDLVDGKVFLSVWNTDLSEAFDFQISLEEVSVLANEYDETR